MVDGEQSSSYVRERQNDYEKLWQDLQIDFRLESFKFPDNKIYGTINIIPESSRKLIKSFVLVIDTSKRIEFDPHYENLSASGFNTNRKNSSVYIEAIPNNTKWTREVKISKVCYFYFTGEVFALSPTINFKWSDDEENPKPNLIIKWYHIGDKNAQQYILYLDDVEIRYIHQKQIEDSFCTSICGFECGQKHTFQLAARLNNGKETYRSDLIEFTVPNKESIDDASIEFITVSNEPPPPDLPVVIAASEDEIEEGVNRNKKNENFHRLQTQLLEQIEKRRKPMKIYTCCNQLPHETFPGIEHYFNNMINKLPSSQRQSFNKQKRTISSKDNNEETDDDDDDDDHIIMPNNQK